MRLLLTVLALVVALAPLAPADETVRQVQEELRKRNLYFGNIDGQTSPVLIDALKRYQARKGFAVTGKVDNDTATSLHIKVAAIVSAEPLPDVPVLRSDTASVLPDSQRRALQRDAEEKGGDLAPTPPPPAESPSVSQDITPERVNQFIENYLRDGETHDVASQVKYYAFPVCYFDHGSVSEEFVTKDTANYVKRWPDENTPSSGHPTFLRPEMKAKPKSNLRFRSNCEAMPGRQKAGPQAGRKIGGPSGRKAMI